MAGLASSCIALSECCLTPLCHDAAAGRKLSQFPIQAAGVGSFINAGQLNQAAAQQTAQAVLGTAANGAAVTQGNVLLG